MSVAVIGAGAVGVVLAAASANPPASANPAGPTVCLRAPVDRIELLTAPGSPLPSGPVDARLVTSPDDLPGPVDEVFVTVKASDNQSACLWLHPLCRPGTLVVVVQNGLDQERRFRLPEGVAAVAGLAYLAAERLAPGRVRHLSGNALVVPAAVAARVQAALPRMEVRGAEDMVTACWRKLLGNLVANPITALTMRRIGVMTELGIADLARGLLREAVAVGRASGAVLGDGDVEAVVAGATRWGPETGSSMLYDRLAGRPTEHEFLTGEVVRRGRDLGIDVPLNAAILALLRAVDAGRANAAAPSVG